MSIELYDKKGEKEYAVEGIKRKIIEMTGRIKIFLESGSWILDNTPALKEKVACIGDMLETVGKMLNNDNYTKNIIDNSNLDHQLGNYLFNLISIDRIDKNRYNLGASEALIGVLIYKTDDLLAYLSKITADPEYLKFVLTHPEKEETKQDNQKAA